MVIFFEKGIHLCHDTATIEISAELINTIYLFIELMISADPTDLSNVEMSTNVSRLLSDSLSFPSMDILISKASKFLWVNLYLRRVLIKFIYEKLLSTEAGMIK